MEPETVQTDVKRISVWAFKKHLGWKESPRAAIGAEDAVRRWVGDHHHKIEDYEPLLVVVGEGEVLGLFTVDITVSAKTLYSAGVEGEGS